MMMGSIFIGEPQVRAGRLRMLAVMGPARAPRYPDVPTEAETIPAFEASSHVGLHVPAGTPREAIEKLYSAMAAAVAQPNVRERMLSEGITPLGTRPEVYGEYLRRETDKWSKLIQQTGIKLE
jgi:tripartite-type tricarboxylate transporter receptor subunit TctC